MDMTFKKKCMLIFNILNKFRCKNLKDVDKKNNIIEIDMRILSSKSC